MSITGIIWLDMGEASEKLLGKAIQSARQKAGLTQQQLCMSADLSYSTLAKIERGAIKTPSVFTVQRISQALGLSMDDLLGVVVHTGASGPAAKKTSKSGIKFLYLDINGCLVRFFQGAFVRISHDTGVSSDLIESTFWHYNDAVCRGEITMEEFNGILAHRLGVPTIDWTEYYMDAVETIKESHDLVAWAAQHYRVGLLSNIMPGYITELITRGKLPDLPYDVIIDSSEVHAIKPEPEVYEIAQKRARVAPEEILFVDDSRTNLMAAERLGWRVLWFDDYRPAEAVEKIRSALTF